jgi:hypothetical protein
MEQRQDGRAAAPAHCPATRPTLDEPAAAAARPAAPARSEIADTLRLHRQDHWHDELRTGGRAILVTLTLRHHAGMALRPAVGGITADIFRSFEEQVECQLDQGAII